MYICNIESPWLDTFCLYNTICRSNTHSVETALRFDFRALPGLGIHSTISLSCWAGQGSCSLWSPGKTIRTLQCAMLLSYVFMVHKCFGFGFDFSGLRIEFKALYMPGYCLLSCTSRLSAFYFGVYWSVPTLSYIPRAFYFYFVMHLTKLLDLQPSCFSFFQSWDYRQYLKHGAQL